MQKLHPDFGRIEAPSARHVNKRNFRFVAHWKPMHPKRVIIRCGFGFFFENKQEVTVKNWREGGYWQYLISTRRRYVPHSIKTVIWRTLYNEIPAHLRRPGHQHSERRYQSEHQHRNFWLPFTRRHPKTIHQSYRPYTNCHNRNSRISTTRKHPRTIH